MVNVDLLDLVKPVIEDYSSSRVIVSKSPVTFSCTATGNPKPRVTWRVNGMPASNTDKHSIDDDTLTILYTDAADTGSYTCVAHNSVSNGTQLIDFSVEASANLTVLGMLEMYDSVMHLFVVIIALFLFPSCT